eukprot:scaffold98120_cov66-Phaeocystis_antarctica.AAC.2
MFHRTDGLKALQVGLQSGPHDGPVAPVELVNGPRDIEADSVVSRRHQHGSSYGWRRGRQGRWRRRRRELRRARRLRRVYKKPRATVGAVGPKLAPAARRTNVLLADSITGCAAGIQAL